MSSLIVAGDTSGTVTLQAPAVAGTTVLTLPSSSGSGLVLNTTLSSVLGSVTATAVNSLSISGLTLTPYKQIQILFNGAGNSGGSIGAGVYISSNNQQTGGGFATTNKASYYGIITVDLGTGIIGGAVNSGANLGSNSGLSAGGLSNISTSSTTIYFRWDSTNTFTAGGTISIYGVY